MSVLIYKESLESLKNASFIGVCAIIIFFFSLITIFIYKLVSKEGDTDIDTDTNIKFYPYMLLPKHNALDIIGSLPTVFLSFTFQFNLFPIFSTLKEKTNKGMIKGTMIGVIFCLVVYLITGFIGFFMYRNSMKQSILDALLLDGIRAKENGDTFLISVLIIVNVAFLISSTMSIPLMFFSLKKNFLGSVIFCKKKFGKGQSSSHVSSGIRTNTINSSKQQKDDLLTTDSLDSERVIQAVDKPKPSSIANSTKYIIITILYCSICLLTIIVPGLKTVCE